MKLFKSYLYRQKMPLALLGLGAAVAALFTFLYELPAEPFWYGTALIAAAAAAGFAGGFWRYARRCAAVQQAHWAENELPEPGDELERRYRAALRAAAARENAMAAAARAEREERADTFTLWAHQIKTPIAAMNLLLQEQQPALPELRAELFKTERYVELALGCLRLEEGAEDLVLQKTELDPIVRGALHKLAQLFILKKISMDYDPPAGLCAVTDPKWLGFILEQLLLNAVKYTPAGGRVRITLGMGRIAVADTGIGIRAEDLPRIFEKGYTGYNGRENKKSTGLGLYLSSRAAAKIGAALHAESAVGQGSRITITLPDAPIHYE